jgi:hypothetical protein
MEDILYRAGIEGGLCCGGSREALEKASPRRSFSERIPDVPERNRELLLFMLKVNCRR